MRKAVATAGFGPVLLIIMTLPGCGPGGGGKAQLSPAQACLQSLDPATGIDLCRQAMTDNPDDHTLRPHLALLRLKAGQLPSARQAYQVAKSEDPASVEAQFGYALTLQIIGEAGGAASKKAAAARDPAVIDRFRGYGFQPPDLMLFDTEPVIVGGQSPAEDKAMIPKQPKLTQGLSVNVRCLVGLDRKMHDCTPTSPLAPNQAVFGAAAVKILSTIRALPAKDKGAPLADAPLYMTYVFWPQDQNS